MTFFRRKLSKNHRAAMRSAGGERVVRSAEGARRYGVPIGTPISAAKAKNAASAKPAKKMSKRAKNVTGPKPPVRRASNAQHQGVYLGLHAHSDDDLKHFVKNEPEWADDSRRLLAARKAGQAKQLSGFEVGKLAEKAAKRGIADLKGNRDTPEARRAPRGLNAMKTPMHADDARYVRLAKEQLAAGAMSHREAVNALAERTRLSHDEIISELGGRPKRK